VNTLPPSLVRFESQLEQAINRQRGRRLRNTGIRGAVAGLATVAVALGVLHTVPGPAPSVVERATAALTSREGAVLHVVALSSDGATSSRIEVWQQTRPPYDQRLIMSAGKRQYEFATVDGSRRIYDPSTNTIISAPRVDADAKQLPPGKAGASEPGEKPIDAGGNPFRGKILALLESGKAKEAGQVTIDGRQAIRIVSTGRELELLVDARSYEPVEWRFTANGIRTTTRFPTYEHLGPESLASLSLTAQHPDARIDDHPAAYRAAQQRLGLPDRH
jgi:hypothetical protein